MHFQQRPWKHDPRSANFSHSRFFGTVTTLPESLNRPLGPVFNQGQTLRCTGYGSAHNGWYIWGKLFSPDYSAARIGKIQGRSVDIGGADPNSCMKSMRDYGFLPNDAAPYTLERDGVEGSGWDKWSENLDTIARDNRVAGYVKVDAAETDYFDDIRNALYQAYDPNTQRGACVDAFGRWFTEWSFSKVIPQTYTQFAGYHRYLFVDWKHINGTPYLIAHNSYGPSFGDKGFHYFPREVVNREFSQRGTTLKIVKRLTREQIELAKQETPMGKLQRTLIELWYNVTELAERIYVRIT